MQVDILYKHMNFSNYIYLLYTLENIPFIL